MKPVLDDIFIPYGWAPKVFCDDKMAFTRDADQIALSAERTEDCPDMPELCSGQLWALYCEQRAGEAKSDIPLGYVTTMETAVQRLLSHMHRINEAAESADGMSVNRMIELLRDEAPHDGHDS